ncbi:AI-2E family transporter [Deinococcus planocerae]|uniref:AI-2E family transporter n=1 Tax=Deinococcus planocerae TaxID=1737569 RepID=UPI000C7F433A|nr:AI-2E family transporter [Deinococcus planocerae]
MNPNRTVPQFLAELWTRPQVRLLCYLGLLVLAFLLVRSLSGVLVTVALAYGLAYLANPALTWLERRGLARGWGVLLLTLLVLAAVVLLFWRLAGQVNSFIVSLPAIADRVTELLERTLDNPNPDPGIDQLQYRFAEYVQTRAQEIARDVGPLLDRLLSSSTAVLTNWLNWLGRAGLLLTLTLYFALDYRRVGRGLLAVFPRDWQPGVERFSEDVSVSFGRAIRGNLLVGLSVGALAAAGLFLLKVPTPLVLGLFTAAMWLVPYVGILIAVVPALLQAIPLGTTAVVLVAVLYFILNQVGGNLLSPVIMGRTIQIPPSALMVAVLIGLSVGGALGAFLASPVALLVYRWGTRYWLGSRAYQGQTGRGEQREEGAGQVDEGRKVKL